MMTHKRQPEPGNLPKVTDKREVTHQSVRAARDRVIDLLGFGFTWPVTDVKLPGEQVKVPFDTQANIPIEDSQQGVMYQLQDQHGVPVVNEDDDSGFYQREGNGGTLLLPTRKIVEDQRFSIWARKRLHEDNDDLKHTYAAHLNQSVEIKVGLDTSLEAEIINNEDILDPNLDRVLPESARIIHYNVSVTVEIRDSQEGVQYQLVEVLDGEAERVLSDIVIGLGRGQSVQLETIALVEDVDIRIRATKQFDLGDAREDETALLDTTLPLKVRARTDLVVFVGSVDADAGTANPGSANPIVAFADNTVVHIQSTQSSARYRLFQHRVADSEMVFEVDGVGSDKWFSAAVPGRAEPVKVLKPPREDIWFSVPPGFSAASEEEVGTGGTLGITLEGVEDDKLVIVQAVKYHTESEKVIASAVQQEAAVIVLARPDDNRPLTLRLSEERKTIRVFDGQPGIFYGFRLQQAQEDISLPAYFHQWAAHSLGQNKGVGELRLEVDFVVTVDRYPQSPQLEVAQIPAAVELEIRAQKAMTSVVGTEPRRILLPQLHQATALENPVEINTATNIRIADSQPGVLYQLFIEITQPNLARIAVDSEPTPGNGGELLLPTGTITTDTRFIVRATHSSLQNIIVEYERTLVIQVLTPEGGQRLVDEFGPIEPIIIDRHEI